MSKGDVLHFPPFRLDRASQRLYRQAVPVPLRPKAWAVLQYLAEHPGRLVTKEELLEAVWPGTWVSDTVLKVCIREIREALEDDAVRPRVVETAHRRGYRFLPVVTAAPVPFAGTERSGPPLVGRAPAIERLRAALARAGTGARTLVFVTGEAGIGKTAVTDAFLRDAAGRGAAVARGHCLEHVGPRSAHLPLFDILSSLAAIAGQPVAATLARLAPSWLAQLPGLGTPTASVPLAASPERLLRELAEALEALAQETPLVVVVEDLHWSDRATLDALSYLARRRGHALLLVVATFRPHAADAPDAALAEVTADLLSRNLAEELPLGLLTPADVAAYLEARFQVPGAAGGFAGRLHAHTGGNPLFLVSVVDYLVERGALAPQSTGPARAERDALLEAVPATVRRTIGRQLDALDEETRHLLEAGSVAGQEFSAALVSAALGRDQASVEAGCERLIRRGFFVDDAGVGAWPDGTLAMKVRMRHALHRAVLYDGIPEARRARWHRAMGLCLERVYGTGASDMSIELARHFERGHEPARAVHHQDHAARALFERLAYHEAAAAASRGLNLLEGRPAGGERTAAELGLLQTLGRALMLTRGYAAPEVEQTWARARLLGVSSGDPASHAHVLSGLWGFHLIRADLTAARALSAELLALAAGLDDAWRLHAHWSAEVVAVNAGDFRGALDHFDAAKQLEPRGPQERSITPLGQDARVSCRCMAAWAAWSAGWPDRALGLAREGVALAHELAHPLSSAFAAFFAAFVHQLAGDAPGTRRWADETVALAEREGLPIWIAFGAILRGWARARAGAPSEGVDEIDRSLAAYRATGAAISLPHFLALRAEALVGCARHAEALASLDEAIALSAGTGNSYYDVELHRLRAGALAAVGGPHAAAEAKASLDRALAIATRQQAPLFALRAAADRLRLARGRADRAASRAVLDRWLGALSEGFSTADYLAARAAADGRSA